MLHPSHNPDWPVWSRAIVVCYSLKHFVITSKACKLVDSCEMIILIHLCSKCVYCLAETRRWYAVQVLCYNMYRICSCHYQTKQFKVTICIRRHRRQCQLVICCITMKFQTFTPSTSYSHRDFPAHYSPTWLGSRSFRFHSHKSLSIQQYHHFSSQFYSNLFKRSVGSIDYWRFIQ